MSELTTEQKAAVAAVGPAPGTPLHDQMLAERAAVEAHAAKQRRAAERADREAWDAQLAAKHAQRVKLLALKRQARTTIAQATEVLLGACQQFLDSSPDPQSARSVMQNYFAAKLIRITGEIPPFPQYGSITELVVEEA